MREPEKNVTCRCVIIGGAAIGNYEAVRAYLHPDSDFYIFCDCGLAHTDALGIVPDLIVGDFDSDEAPRLGDFGGAEVITLSHFKDDTDTEHAVRVAEERGFTDFLLLGVIGGRFDHSLGNVALLCSLFSDGCRALAVDDWSEMEIVGSEPAEIPDSFAYFSVVPVGGTAYGVFEENALYPLEDAVITPETTLGISNEPLPGRTARIWTCEGRLLLVRVRR
jgi:thiamine pyrophosphokinase